MEKNCSSVHEISDGRKKIDITVQYQTQIKNIISYKTTEVTGLDFAGHLENILHIKLNELFKYTENNYFNSI